MTTFGLRGARTTLVLAMVGLLVGCSEEASKSAASSGSAAGATTPQLTVAEVEAVLRPALADLEKGDWQAYAALFDRDALVDRVTEGLEINVAARRAFDQGVGPFGRKFGQRMVASMHGGGTYRLLRVREVNGQIRALTRLLHLEGVNYHDSFFEADEAGRPRIVDIYLYVAGEPLSETIRRAVLPIVAHANRSVFSRLTGHESDYVKHFDQIQQVIQEAQAGDPSRVVRLYEGLPASVKDDKNLLLLCAMTAASVDEAKYRDLMERYAELYPNDPALWLMNIDRYFIARKFEKLFHALDKLDAKLGGDPYLNVLRANAHYEMENLTEARRFLDAAIQAEPTLSQPYWTLADIALIEGDFEQLAELFLTLEFEFGVEFHDLRTAPEYADFVKDSAYEQYLAQREERQQQ